MDFSKRKLPVEATSKLRMCPIGTVKPFALMIAPVYVFMRRNEKFISVKAPLDFFTAEELERLRPLEMFFMPEFVDQVLPYRDLARRVKRILKLEPASAPAPYEISDAVLRLMAPLWGRNFQIEPFFVCAFVNELCALLPGPELVMARERNTLTFERAAILSAWMVLLSLHIGVTDLNYLDALRLRVFRRALGTGDELNVPSLENYSDTGELFRMLDQILAGELTYRSLGLDFFGSRPERIAQKTVARIRRIHSESLAGPLPLEGTVHGERGFADG